MSDLLKFYINGQWVEPSTSETIDVINPATEQPIGKVAMGGVEDVNKAVAAAKAAFPTYSQTSKTQRIELLEAILAKYEERMGDLASCITQEMGAPISLSREVQAPSGYAHLATTLEVLKNFEFEEDLGTSRVVKEPVGVCSLISPWNFPLNQIACKVAPALAAGCTMVLKPSEVAPFNARIFAEILDSAGVPPGVFNLVFGDGPTVGAEMSKHEDVDMVSLTGGSGAGVAVTKNAAPTVKRVALELGGKSANIILDDADFAEAIPRDVFFLCANAGQVCLEGTRMLVPKGRMDEAAAIAKAAAEQVKVGDPMAEDTRMGPVANKAQFDKIQRLIQKGIDEGAKLEAGGTGRPDGLSTGYYVKPTIFSHVTNDMTIAREEIFGPVLSIIGYEDDEDAVRIANDSLYGLSGYVSGSPERAKKLARLMRTGSVFINGALPDFKAPFGGYKQSGNGREWGHHGIDEFLEVKSVYGYEERKK